MYVQQFITIRTVLIHFDVVIYRFAKNKFNSKQDFILIYLFIQYENVLKGFFFRSLLTYVFHALVINLINTTNDTKWRAYL